MQMTNAVLPPRERERERERYIRMQKFLKNKKPGTFCLSDSEAMLPGVNLPACMMTARFMLSV